ncbi:hypothetical protein [Radiobacillus deserti]|uniref:Swarming motility protein SwrB n=1 Tax=Radiobacillus deserti TaxID=2594883 RepID=A0A516KFL9_9BACI|nr:hypothetical protein [Radiobacillus deserti]QDP40202.1 hypothetical protein FN924_08470 [Radiobacillus deserti]
MLTLLVMMSLFLHVLSFIAIRLLLNKVNKLSQTESNYNQRVSEMEDLFATYLEEIKLENEKLEQAMNQTRIHEQTRPSSIISEIEPASIKKQAVKDESPKKGHIKNIPAIEPEKRKEYAPPTELPVEDTVEQSLQSKVYQLHDQGFSVEEIAKQLDCGKTEVDLMLKFKS